MSLARGGSGHLFWNETAQADEMMDFQRLAQP